MKWREQITIPNILTLLRFFCIPWMAVEIYRSKGYSPLSAGLFIGIWLTDILDGWIARHFNQVSDVGKVLDPLVDKIFQLTTAIMMCIVERLPLWVPVTLLIKELLMVAGGIFLWKQKVVVSSRWYGKLATVLLALAFVVLFFLPADKLWLNHFLFIVPVGMSLFSLVNYAYGVWNLYKSGALAKPLEDRYRDPNSPIF